MTVSNLSPMNLDKFQHCFLHNETATNAIVETICVFVCHGCSLVNFNEQWPQYPNEQGICGCVFSFSFSFHLNYIFLLLGSVWIVEMLLMPIYRFEIWMVQHC